MSPKQTFLVVHGCLDSAGLGRFTLGALEEAVRYVSPLEESKEK